MQKRITKMFLMFVVFSICAMTTFASSFKDVPETHWAYKYIEDMQKRGIMLINSKGEFLPNNQISYFELMEILAKITDYDPQNVVVMQNYELQKPMLEEYAKKYGLAWDKRFDDKIAYLYGKGYIIKDDINKLLVKDAKGAYVKAITTKQDLSVYLVRVLQRQETAKKEYQTTGFADEMQISAENRPHVAYLKKIGIVNGDAKNAFSPNAPVTRALASKMISDVLAYKEKQSTATTPQPISTNTNDQQGTMGATLKKLIEKNESEYYVLLDKGNGSTSFYTMKKTAAITDASGTPIAASDIKLESQVKVIFQKENGIDYISHMAIVKSGDVVPTPPTHVTIAEGTIDRIGSNNDISILINEVELQTYRLSDNCTIVIDGQKASYDDLVVDVKVKVYIQSDNIIRLDVLSSTPTQESGVEVVASQNQGEVLDKYHKKSNYVLYLSVQGKKKEVEIPLNAEIIRNNKETDFYGIKIGDTVKVGLENDNLVTKTKVVVSGTESKIQGTLKEIIIAAVPKVTVATDQGDKTFAITAATDLYDSTTRTDISVRDLRMDQKVQLLLDSKEVVSLIVEKDAPSVRYKGTIENIGKGNKYIEVLVDYDPLTGDTMVMKRINISLDVEILIDDLKEHVSSLKLGDEVLITYNYIDDTYPKKITVVD